MAGENRVYTASIELGKGSASRLGGGAVMGDKGIKAIAVRGTKDIYFARPAEFIERCNEVRDYTKWRLANLVPGVEPVMSGLGVREMLITDEEWHTQNFSWGNARTRRKDFWTKEIDKSWTDAQLSAVKRFISCFNCPAQCGALIKYKDIPEYQMKCFSKITYAMGAYVDNLDFSYKIARRAFEYGMDSFSTPQILAFGFELYEAGILTDADFTGTSAYEACPSDKEGRFIWLLDRVARREGIGDILANGVYWAARQIGKGAEEFDHNTIKKHEQLPIKLNMLNPLYYLMYATNEKVSITQVEGVWPQAPMPTREEREEFVKDWVNVPDEKFKQWFVDWELRGEKGIPYYPTVDMSCEIVDWMETSHVLDDALGICCSMSSFMLKTPYHIHNLPGLISAATGLDIDEAELLKVAKRNRTLHRALNNRFGMRKADEKPPEDHWKKRFPELEKELLDKYYKFKGWNYDGIPTKETLEELDLGYVAEDLERRGILKNGQD